MNNTKQKFGGRAKGTPNKATAELRERFTSLLESNFDTIQSDLNTLEPKDRIKTILEISKFVIPTLKAVENSIELNNEDLRFDFDIKSIVQFDKIKQPKQEN
jgi:hypothetical protein